MISGDMHMLSYDLGPAPGEKNLKTNEAPFPIFQCAPLDKKASCKSGMTWSAYPSFGNSQYCVFEFRQKKEEVAVKGNKDIKNEQTNDGLNVNKKQQCLLFLGFQGTD